MYHNQILLYKLYSNNNFFFTINVQLPNKHSAQLLAACVCVCVCVYSIYMSYQYLLLITIKSIDIASRQQIGLDCVFIMHGLRKYIENSINVSK